MRDERDEWQEDRSRLTLFILLWMVCGLLTAQSVMHGEIGWAVIPVPAFIVVGFLLATEEE